MATLGCCSGFSNLDGWAVGLPAPAAPPRASKMALGKASAF
ncbi:MAG: hypothetical protein ACK4SY_09690 [Pyrobaculum sp.]